MCQVWIRATTQKYWVITDQPCWQKRMGNGLLLRKLVVQGDSVATLLCRAMLVKGWCFQSYGLCWELDRHGAWLKNGSTFSLDQWSSSLKEPETCVRFRKGGRMERVSRRGQISQTQKRRGSREFWFPGNIRGLVRKIWASFLSCHTAPTRKVPLA